MPLKSNDKSIIRQQVRQFRRSLTSTQTEHASQKLLQTLLQWPKFQKARFIAGYLAQDGELPLKVTIEYCWQHSKSVYLPILRPLPPNRLWFAPYQRDCKMHHNRYGIAEPLTPLSSFWRVSQLDIVLFPLVAFDSSGGRLGMGGGFYDRTFAHLLNSRKRPGFVGVAYEEQQVASLPIEPWDIPLDAVVTPEKIYEWS